MIGWCFNCDYAADSLLNTYSDQKPFCNSLYKAKQVAFYHSNPKDRRTRLILNHLHQIILIEKNSKKFLHGFSIFIFILHHQKNILFRNDYDLDPSCKYFLVHYFFDEGWKLVSYRPYIKYNLIVLQQKLTCYFHWLDDFNILLMSLNALNASIFYYVVFENHLNEFQSL